MTAARVSPAANVHLVDDEEPVRDALGFLFRSHGLLALTYASGPALLAAVDAAAPSLPLRGCIVLDVRMEPLSGLQVHDELLARRVGNPVIFFLATATSQWRWTRCTRAPSTLSKSPSATMRWFSA